MNTHEKTRNWQAWHWEEKLYKHVSSCPKANSSLWNRCLYWLCKFLWITLKVQINSQATFWISGEKVIRPLSLKIGDEQPIIFLVGKVALLLDDGHLYWQRKCSRHYILTCQTVVPKAQRPWQITLRTALLECEKKGNNLFSAQR